METTTETPPKTIPARPKGRPKKDSIPPEAATAKAFPEPPRSTIKDGTISQEKFWAYREDLPVEFIPRLSFYVYREKPTCDVYRKFSPQELAEIKAGRRKKPIKYIAQYPDIDPKDWRNQLLRCHGSGTYKLLLNDAGVRGNKDLERGNVCSTFVEINDSEFLPIIEDLSILKLEDPSNNWYINELRLRGVPIPGDTPPQEDTEGMAATVAVEKLADALVKQSETKAPDNTAALMISDLLKQSEARHMKELELAEARHIRDLEALTKRLEAAEKSANSAPTTTQQVIEMARAIIPPPAPPPALPPPQDNRMADLLMQMLQSEKTARIEELKLADARHARELEAMNKRLEAMDARETARIQKLEAAPPAPASAQASVFKEVIGALEGLNKLKERMGGEEGGTGNPWVDLAAELGPRVLDTISHVTTALKGPATPMTSQGMPQQQVGTELQTQQPQQQDNTEMGQMATYARMIRQPLIQCLSANPPVPGHRFAGMLIVQYGDAAYNYLCQQGADGVLSILQAAPEVWGDVQRFGAKVPQFLTEFLDSPRAMEQAQAIRAGQGQRPSMPASAPLQQQQARSTVVDAPPASQVPQSGGRTILRPDGQAVKTNGPVNGPVVEPPVT